MVIKAHFFFAAFIHRPSFRQPQPSPSRISPNPSPASLCASESVQLWSISHLLLLGNRGGYIVGLWEKSNSQAEDPELLCRFVVEGFQHSEQNIAHYTRSLLQSCTSFPFLLQNVFLSQELSPVIAIRDLYSPRSPERKKRRILILQRSHSRDTYPSLSLTHEHSSPSSLLLRTSPVTLYFDLGLETISSTDTTPDSTAYNLTPCRPLSSSNLSPRRSPPEWNLMVLVSQYLN